MPARGQYDNLGDVMLRRRLLDWVRPAGRLHVYLGPAPTGYTDGLRLSDDDVAYRSFGAWYAAGSRAAARGQAAYVFKPGEIQLTAGGLKEHLGLLPLVAAVRARGGPVVRVGSGARNLAAGPRLLMAPSVRLSSVVAWRDADTAAYLGVGSVMPDLAFGEGRPDAELSLAGGRRDRLVVSLRSDRALPGPAWFAGVRAYADQEGLRVVAVSQVHRDDRRARVLASLLAGEHLAWDGTAHDRHEEALRARYGRAAVVVSDRLHVLVAALTEGAVPAAAVPGGSPKVERHFAAAGITGVSADVGAADRAGGDAVRQALAAAVGRRAELLDGLVAARRALDGVRADVDRALRR